MIEIKDLSKNFGKSKAINNLNISIPQGEAASLWGSNGAGKTTLIRCLLGVIPFQGEIQIDGKSLKSNDKEIKKLIGFVPQEISLHDNLSVEETINFYSQIKKTSFSSIGKWEKILSIRKFEKKLIRELSGGMKQKLALALALLNNPPILLLDEPTANLDLKSRDDFLQLLTILKQEGKTILFSSHRIEEVLSFADRVLVLDNGNLIADAPPMEIYRRFGKNGTLKIFINSSVYDQAINILLEKGFASSRNGKGILVKVDPEYKIVPLKILLEQGMQIENFDYDIELF